MNRTLKEATVKRFYYQTHEHYDFISPTSSMLTTSPEDSRPSKGLTPYEYICSLWTKEPQRFKLNPAHLTLGLYIHAIERDTEANRKRREEFAARSAIAAIPALDETSAFLSSGTWSLIGVKEDKPNLSDESFEDGFTNEGSADGEVVFLKN